MPVLCLWGTNDHLLPDTAREFFRRHLPAHAIFEEPEGYGHAPYVDHADDFVRRIAAFARRSTEARRAA
jgi:pimeloyl-ACP methyl ester carboxylesterase